MTETHLKDSVRKLIFDVTDAPDLTQTSAGRRITIRPSEVRIYINGPEYSSSTPHVGYAGKIRHISVEGRRVRLTGKTAGTLGDRTSLLYQADGWVERDDKPTDMPTWLRDLVQQHALEFEPDRFRTRPQPN